MLWWPEAANGVCPNGVHTSYQRGVGLLDSESVQIRWETVLPGYEMAFNPFGGAAVADLDLDGATEIVVVQTTQVLSGADAPVVILDGSTGSIEWVWTTPGLRIDEFTPAVGDIDLDGHPEIVVANNGYDWPTGIPCVRVFALDGVTREVDWTRDLIGDSATSYGRGYSPSIADADGDGKPEVLMSADLVQNTVWSLWCLNGEDGSVVWKKDSVRAPIPVCGDVNGDGVNEVIAYGWFRWGIAWRRAVQALSGVDGSVVWRADTNIVMSYPCIADVDADGKLEVVGMGIFRSQPGIPRFFCLDGETGSTKWVYTPAKHCAFRPLPAIAQMDSDPAQESVCWFEGWRLYWVDGLSGGTDWIYERGDSIGVYGPTAADIDNDGDIEVIVGFTRYPNQDSGLMCLSGGKTGPPRVKWSFNLAEAGIRGQGSQPIIADVDDDGYLERLVVPEDVTGFGNVKVIVLDNERALAREEKAARPPSMLVLPGRIVLSLLDPCPVDLSLYDMSGRRVKELYKGQLPPGTHEFELRGLEPGVYLAELRYDGRITTKAVVMRR